MEVIENFKLLRGPCALIFKNKSLEASLETEKMGVGLLKLRPTTCKGTLEGERLDDTRRMFWRNDMSTSLGWPEIQHGTALHAVVNVDH